MIYCSVISQLWFLYSQQLGFDRSLVYKYNNREKKNRRVHVTGSPARIAITIAIDDSYISVSKTKTYSTVNVLNKDNIINSRKHVLSYSIYQYKTSEQ